MTAPARACPACKTPLPEAAHFCLNCGTATPTEPGVPPRTVPTDIGEIARVRKALKDNYAVERILGEGGMATVYLATDLKHRRQVAVKVMRPELAATLGAERFLREVEIAAQLSHPHILPVHDSGDAGGVLYYVMPYVEGESLHDRIKRETSLPVDEALRLIREVSEALAYAHGRKIIHRDIKPANIMLTQGHALVADFGIARAVGAGGGAAITKTGLAVGTPQYMSPEQAGGSASVDARSDIFAVGCVLYEMLAGEPPFTGPTPQAIVIRSMTEAPRSLVTTRDGLSPAIEAVVMRALAKNPSDRWQTAADFAVALGNAHDQLRLGPLSGARTPAPQPAITPGPSLAKVWSTFAVVGVLALVLVFGLVRRWGLPVWALGLAIGLLAVGAVVLAITGRMEDRRAAGQSVTGLAGRFTWRNAALGGLAALGFWAVVAMVLVFRGPGGAAGGLVRLAVLPFENRGAPEDGYIVDGITDQVRGKLMDLAGFQVTARTSSDPYKGSKLSPQEIGKELGVDYLLTSTVTWIKNSGNGKGRVQVVPELIAVKTGAGTWQRSFDAELTDIFQVQGTIATQVAGALNVALGPKEQQQLAERPTQNLAAYDLYLKAEAITASDPISSRRAVGLYEQAVAEDPNFSQAWSHMVGSLAQLYFNGTPTPEVAERARVAVERAKALDPDGVEPLLADARYKYLVANDPAGAMAETERALQLAPNNAEVLRMAASQEQVHGRWEQALAHTEQARRLDPRSVSTLRNLQGLLTLMHKYPEALAVSEEVLAAAPTDVGAIEGQVFPYLLQGDLSGARSVINRAAAVVPRTTLVAYFALYQDLYWVLTDEDQQLVLRMPPSAYDGDRAIWATTFMQIYDLRGDKARARAFADTARIEYDKQLLAVPKDPQRNLFRGMALALLGRKAEAIEAAERGNSYAPLATDKTNGAYNQHQLARVYLMLGEKEKALDLLEPLTRMPYYLTPGYLRIDPNFIPLKGNPRFEKLLKGS